MNAGELAATARCFMDGRSLAVARVPGQFAFWPRAAAVLGRQALEKGLDDFWATVSPSIRQASRHAQLLCLDAFLTDTDLASRVRLAWHGLSRACHHQVYELPPTTAELDRWLDAVERLVEHDPEGDVRQQILEK
jgi:hypothetical protein